MSKFGRSRGGGRRRTARECLSLVAVFTTMVRSEQAVVIDISITGVRLRGIDLPRAGEDILLNIEGEKLFCTVAWSRSGQCGIVFNETLPPGKIQAFKKKLVAAGSVAPDVKSALDDRTSGIAR